MTSSFDSRRFTVTGVKGFLGTRLSRKLRERFGFVAGTSVEEGLRRTIEWYRGTTVGRAR